MFDLAARISAFDTLGRFLGQIHEKDESADLARLNDFFWEPYQKAIVEAGLYNNWFTNDNVKFALSQWAKSLSRENLEKWVSRYNEDYFTNETRTIAIIMAGNIPMVGFHDFLSVLMSGHKVLVKPSSDDSKLLPFIAQVLVAIDKRFAGYIAFADGQIRDFDAVIATGSNNSARYFDYYFGKYPNIIRKNRTSVAVLKGDEEEGELKRLGEDIFRYFGLGCRNVSKLYLPRDFDLNRLFAAFYDYKDVIENTKYANNYDYNRAISLMEKHEFLENGFLILKKEKAFHAPVAVLHYERYDDPDKVVQDLHARKEELQCVVSRLDKLENSILPGETQQPALWDYADNLDTIAFLKAV